MLDVACGTGVVTRLAVKDRVEVSQAWISTRACWLLPAPCIGGTPIDGSRAARRPAIPTHSFDIVLCQLGLQFFPDQGRALREMRRVLEPPVDPP